MVGALMHVIQPLNMPVFQFEYRGKPVLKSVFGAFGCSVVRLQTEISDDLISNDFRNRKMLIESDVMQTDGSWAEK